MESKTYNCKFNNLPNNVKLEFIDTLSPNDEKEMEKDLIAYEAQHKISVNYQKFSLVFKTKDDQLIGVLQAFTAYSEIYIDNIWVHSSYRGHGYGRQLLEILESEHEGKGFNNMNLVTSAFQAPIFYEKCGFQVEFVRKNEKNPQFTKTFLVKYFKNKTQTQGILK